MNSAIRLILQAHLNYHTEEAIREKAQNLLAIFEKHGTNLNRQTYIQQTANLDDIFADINNESSLKSNRFRCKALVAAVLDCCLSVRFI
jgi:predicted protein tyrosine phosphatase